MVERFVDVRQLGPRTAKVVQQEGQLATYERGTFTPELLYGATPVTLTDADGVYVRIGDLVTVSVHMVWTEDITAGASQPLTLQNMPFPKDTTISTMGVAAVSNVQQFTTARGFSMSTRFTGNNTGVLRFIWNNISGGDVGNVFASESDAVGTKVIGFTATYPCTDFV